VIRATRRTAAELSGEACDRVHRRLEATGLAWGPRLAALIAGDGVGGETIAVGTPEEIAAAILALPASADDPWALERRQAIEFLTGPPARWAPRCARLVARGDLGDWYSGWLVARYRLES
jgi:hypothetical protein